MNLKKLLIVILLCFGSSYSVKAQYKKIYSILYKLVDENREAYHSDDFYNKSLVFSISIGINRVGVMDTVIYSSANDKLLNRLYNLKAITKGLKADKTVFKPYKNEFLVLIVVLIRGDVNFIKIDNGNEVLENWRSIIESSEFAESTGRKQILLTPYLIYSKGKTINN